MGDKAGMHAWAALGALFVAGAFALHRLTPPAVVPADAPATVFSAARALPHLREVARESHSAGSAASGRVREYLRTQMQTLGLATEVQVARDRWTARATGGTLYNLIGRLRGTANTRAVLLASHYDSAPGSFGAGDAGAGVVAILETVRALRSGPPLVNDLLVLITDAEEVGLCGARAFVLERAEAREVGVAVNFEARGTSGPSILFETSVGNSRLLEAYAGAAPRPVTTSLAYEVYKEMPNDTDLTVFKAAGMPGVGFAFIHDVRNYHTPGDCLDNLDLRSVQHHGENALALARAFGGMDLREVRGPDGVFFDVLAAWVVRYPGAWALPFASAAAVAWAGVVAWGRRSGLVRPGRVGLGALAALGALTAAGGTGACVWFGAKAWHGPAPFRELVEVATRPIGLAATALLAAAAAAPMAAFVGRKLGGANAALGGLAVWLAVAVASAAWVPGASYLFLWPAAASLAGIVVGWRQAGCAQAVAGGGDGRVSAASRGVLASAAGALPGVLLFAPTAALFFDGMTLRMAPVPGLMTGLVVLLLVPVLTALPPRPAAALAGIAAVAGLACLAVAAR
ncbi:MAG: M28 family peptidase [Planctomycetes bacterium]|nr:M28 family peptidase [Planctomycetota bacterium]